MSRRKQARPIRVPDDVQLFGSLAVKSNRNDCIIGAPDNKICDSATATSVTIPKEQTPIIINTNYNINTNDDGTSVATCISSIKSKSGCNSGFVSSASGLTVGGGTVGINGFGGFPVNGDSLSSCCEDDVLVPDNRELNCASYPEPETKTTNQDEPIKSSTQSTDTVDCQKLLKQYQKIIAVNSQLDLHSSPALDHKNQSHYSPGHVTLEALTNTKVAVAQFAATALANGADPNSLKELAVLQSTLFTLQHQQVFQLQLIQQLQSQLGDQTLKLPSKNTVKSDDYVCEVPPDFGSDEKKFEYFRKGNEDENNIFEATDTQNEKSNSVQNKPFKEITQKFDEDQTPKGEIRSNTVAQTSQEELTVKVNQKEMPHHLQDNTIPTSMRSPMCHISSSLASSIITDHDNFPSLNEPNTLDLLQRKAQEVLDSASQGILSGNLVDEITFRKEKLSPFDKERSELKHRCRYCGKIFGSDSALQIHVRSHTGERPFKCNICGSRFTTKGNLKVHFQRHNVKFPHIEMNSHPIPEHLDKFHPPLYDRLTPDNSLSPPPYFQSSSTPISSRLNFYNFPSYQTPIDQLKNLSSKESCTDFNYPSVDENDSTDINKPTESKVINFEEIQKDVIVKAPEEDKEVIIDKERNNLIIASKSPASSSCNSPPELNQLQKISALVKKTEQSTETCSQNYNNSWDNLMGIQKSPETSKLQDLVDGCESKSTDPNQCSFCDRILSSKSALEMHIRTHTGERPFGCRLCGRAFTTKGNLKTHMGVHRMKSPMRTLHQCPICHKRYANALVLHHHIRTHSGELTDMTLDQIRASEINDILPIGGQEYQQQNDTESSNSETSNEPINMNETWNGNEDPPVIKSTEDHNDRKFVPLDKSTPQCSVLQDNSYGLHERHLSINQSFAYNLQVPSLNTVLDRPPIDLTPPFGLPPNQTIYRSQTQPMSIFPFLQHGPTINPTTPLMNSALNTLAHSVLPAGSFNPLGVPGLRGNTTCNICFKTFACHSALEIHYRSHTKERPYKCGICDRGFSTKGNMKQHMLTHKIRDMMPSTYGNNSETASEKSCPIGLNESNKIIDDDNDSRCNSPLIDVSQECDGNDTKVDSDTEVKEKFDKTDEIKLKDISELLSTHKRIRDDDFELKASETKKIASSPHPIHQTHSTNSTNEDRFTYQITASRPFKRSNMDDDHSNKSSSPYNESPLVQSPVHGKYREVEDEVHSERISTQDILDGNPYDSDHSGGEGKHLCLVCRKNFSSTSALQIHTRTHTGDKPFRCNVCDKSFTTKGNLKVHMGTHMWTAQASRRGRRMSLELPVNHSLPIMNLRSTDFFQPHPDIFYSYLKPPFTPTIPKKLHTISSSYPPQPSVSRSSSIHISPAVYSSNFVDQLMHPYRKYTLNNQMQKVSTTPSPINSDQNIRPHSSSSESPTSGI